MKRIILCLVSLVAAIQISNAQCCPEPGYGVNNITDEFVSVDVVTGNYTPIAPLNPALPAFNAGGEIIDCNYYVGSGTSIYSIDKTTGATALVVTAPQLGSETFTGLEVDPTTGIFYASSTNIAQSSLWTIDVGAGTATLVGTAAGRCAISVVIGPDGAAYYIDICTDDIYPIDLATGQPTGPGLPLGFDLNFGQDYSFDCPVGSSTVYGFAFNQGTFSMQYVSIEPATGTTTVIQDFGLDQIASFAFCVEPGGVEIVPTLGEWSIICLGLLMLIFGVTAVTQRRQVIA